MKFSGKEMLLIDIANCYGKDHETWDHRLLWAYNHYDQFEELIHEANQKLLYEKAVYALREADNGFGIGHNMFMDATASGLQIMAVLSGCKKTARHVNLINTGEREDVYTHVSKEMNELLDPVHATDRPLVKKPLMTHYYNKQKQDSFNEEQEEAFNNVLHESFTGAEDVMALINSYWNDQAYEHTWTLPDGHVARVLVTDMMDARVEVDELNHVTFTYRFEANEPGQRNSSLCPNIIHSIDGYIARELIRRSSAEGFEIAHIFDAFCCHPNHMSRLMEMYREVLADIAQMDLLQDILSEISGRQVLLKKDSDDLHLDILNSEYALS